MSKKEKEEVELMRIASENEETFATNPLLQKYLAEEKEELEKLEPYRREAQAHLEELKKKKKNLVKKTEEMAEYYSEQGWSMEKLGDNVVKPRKKYLRENKKLE